MFKKAKRLAREGGIAQILVEQYGMSKREAFDMLDIGIQSGFHKIIDSDSVNPHDRARILVESISATNEKLSTDPKFPTIDELTPYLCNDLGDFEGSGDEFIELLQRLRTEIKAIYKSKREKQLPDAQALSLIKEAVTSGKYNNQDNIQKQFYTYEDAKMYVCSKFDNFKGSKDEFNLLMKNLKTGINSIYTDREWKNLSDKAVESLIREAAASEMYHSTNLYIQQLYNKWRI